jgi:molybdate transport system permease protein
MASGRSAAAAASSGLRRPGIPRSLILASLPLVLLLVLPFVALATYLDPAQWLRQLATPVAARALLLTLLTTSIATLLCVMLGLPVAFLLARHRFRGRDALAGLIDLPITIPPVVVGVALLLAFGRFGLVGQYLDRIGIQIGFSRTAVVLAQLLIACPFFVQAARGGFASVDPRMETAARTLGAGPWRVFWTVSVPLARPSLVVGALLAWARALSEFGATITFAGNFPGRTQTLSLAVMAALESDMRTAVAISMLAVVLGVAVLILARGLAARTLRSAGSAAS